MGFFNNTGMKVPKTTEVIEYLYRSNTYISHLLTRHMWSSFTGNLHTYEKAKASIKWDSEYPKCVLVKETHPKENENTSPTGRYYNPDPFYRYEVLNYMPTDITTVARNIGISFRGSSFQPFDLKFEKVGDKYIGHLKADIGEHKPINCSRGSYRKLKGNKELFSKSITTCMDVSFEFNPSLNLIDAIGSKYSIDCDPSEASSWPRWIEANDSRIQDNPFVLGLLFKYCPISAKNIANIEYKLVVLDARVLCGLEGAGADEDSIAEARKKGMFTIAEGKYKYFDAHYVKKIEMDNKINKQSWKYSSR